MSNFASIPISEDILNELQLTHKNEITVNPLAHTDYRDGGSVIISEITGSIFNETKQRFTIKGTIVLSFFDNRFNINRQICFTELYKEIHSMYIRHEGSLFALPSGELVFSTGFNRVYVFDKNGHKIIKKFNRKVESVLRSTRDVDQFKELNTDNPQVLLNSNLFTRATLCPDTQLLLSLVDTDTNEYVNQKRMRGEIIAISSGVVQLPKLQDFRLLKALNKDWVSGLDQNHTIEHIKNNNGTPVSRKTWPKPIITELEEETGDILTREIWVEQPLSMGEGLFFVPVYSEMYRSGGKGLPFFGFIMNSKGNITAELKELDFRDDSPYAKSNFRFAVSINEKIIFYKNDYAVYRFDYEGNLIEKYNFSEPKVKLLRPYRLIGSKYDGRIILFHEKNQDFIILSPVTEFGNLKDMVAESAKNFTKEKVKAKKKYNYINKCWFEHIEES